MRIVRLFSDDHGESHFADIELGFALVDFAPPAAALELSEVYQAKTFVVVRIPAHWPAGWHPSPRRQIWVGLQGAIRVTASDGETREIPAGVPWLMEDKTGRGHTTVAVAGAPAIGAVTQLD